MPRGERTLRKSRRKRAPCWRTSVSVLSSPASTSIWNTRNLFSMLPTWKHGQTHQ